MFSPNINKVGMVSRLLLNVIALSRQVRFAPATIILFRQKFTLNKPSWKNEPITANVDSTIAGIEKLYNDSLDLDAKYQLDVVNLEMKYNIKYNELYDQRKKLLDDFRKSNQDSVCPKANAIKNFWLEVIRLTKCVEIKEFDEKILKHLIDVRLNWHFEPKLKFVLYFYFEPNEFFNNDVLTKTYFIEWMPDLENPVYVEKPAITDCIGCTIDWKKGHQLPNEEQTYFLDFFLPPKLPDDKNDPTYDEIRNTLENDYSWGFLFKDVIIPKALKVFTGEITNTIDKDANTDNTEEMRDKEEQRKNYIIDKVDSNHNIS